LRKIGKVKEMLNIVRKKIIIIFDEVNRKK